MKHTMATVQTNLKAYLLVIYDIIMFQVGQTDAIDLLVLINELHEKPS